MSIWTTDMIDRLRILAAERVKTAAGLAEALSAEFGLTITRGMVCGKADREGIPLRSQTEAEKGKPRKPAKVKAPSISLIDPPFLPPMPLVREYVPTGRAPVTLLAAKEFVCKQILPGDQSGPDTLFCGNPLPVGRRFRFCGACGERLIVKAKEPKRSTFVTLGKRRAAA